MTETDVIRIVKMVMREHFAPISMASLVSNADQNRSTIQRFKTDSPINRLRNIQPYGVSSRAPKGMPSLVIPVGGDPSHLNMVGHFDEQRPTGLDGETFLYNEFGQLIYLKDGKIQIGTKASAENLVLGQVFKTFMAAVLEAIATHTHAGIGYAPTNAATFESLKASPIEDEAILSDLSFTEKG